MDFSLSPRTQELSASMWDFMREHVFPAESVYPQWRAENPDHARPPVLDEAGGQGVLDLQRGYGMHTFAGTQLLGVGLR
jgi:hypothetical protein